MTTDPAPTPAAQPAPDASLLDAGLIRRHRLALGLTEREFARQAGVGTVVIHNLELGTNHAEMPLAVIAAVARVLGMRPADLLRRDVPSTQSGTGQAGGAASAADSAAEVATAGALLATAGRRVPLTALAEVTGWTLEHTEDVIAELTVDVAAVGLAVEQHIGLAGLVPSAAAASREALQGLARRTFARTGMNLRQARTLHRVWTGALTGAEQDNPTRVALGELVNAGLVDYPAGPRAGRPKLGGDVDLLIS